MLCSVADSEKLKTRPYSATVEHLIIALPFFLPVKGKPAVTWFSMTQAQNLKLDFLPDPGIFYCILKWLRYSSSQWLTFSSSQVAQNFVITQLKYSLTFTF